MPLLPLLNSPWTPRRLGSRLKLWAAAWMARGLVDGDPVAQADDWSGYGNHLTQATAAKRPQWKTGILNGWPVWRLDGTDDFFSAPAITSDEVTVFAVVRPTLAGEHPMIVSVGTTTASGWALYFQTAATPSYQHRFIAKRDGAWADLMASSGVGASAGVAVIMGGQTIGGSADVFVNGTAYNDTGTGGALQYGASPSTLLGARVPATPTNFLTGDIAEVVIVSRILSLAERKRLERWLSRKYGIALA